MKLLENFFSLLRLVQAQAVTSSRLQHSLNPESALHTTGRLNTCKFIPTDDEWPQDTVWESFNETVGGRLIKTVPIGSVCHDPTYDEAQCKFVQENWREVDISLNHPTSIQHSIYLNETCDPFTDRSIPCELGAYPVYAVNVSSPAHVISTLNFVKENNIRLVVKNTGHDYMGRSVGSGAVSIWTHSNQKREWFEVYEDPWSNYKGPAVRLHAGVQGGQILQDGHDRGYYVVVGACPTVGFAGGFVQGGGHSLLSTRLGMAADQVLSFEAITTSGQFINVSTSEHPDLFWALRGGGGGAFAIVWSVTVKAFPDMPIVVGNLSFSQPDNGEDIYWKGIEEFHRFGSTILDAEGWSLSAAISSGNIFAVPALTFPNKALEDVESILSPLFQTFKSINLNYTKAFGSYNTYLDGVKTVDEFQAFPINDYHMTSRLVPEYFFKNEGAFEKYINIIKDMMALGLDVYEMLVAPGRSIGGIPDNAVLPEWRTAERHFIPRKPRQNADSFEKLYADVDEIKTVVEPMFRSLGAGAYLNENNPFTPNWKQDFYGVNYERLLAIKKEYDPDQLLYGSISVGGDHWVQQEDGRLCQANSGAANKAD